MKKEVLSYSAVIYLVSSALNNQKPKKELLVGIPLGSIYSAAASMSLDALVTTALEGIGVTSQHASEMKFHSIKRSLLFDSARAEILSKLEEQGINICP